MCAHEEHAYIASVVYLVITVNGGISNTQAIRRTGKMSGDESRTWCVSQHPPCPVSWEAHD